MFRIFHEQEISRKITHLTPDYCVYKTKAFPCSCTEKLIFLAVLPAWLQRCWQEWQCHRGVGRRLRAVTHSQSALSCSPGNSQGKSAPLHIRTLPPADPGTSLRISTLPPLSCWRMTILYLASETSFHHLPLHGRRMSSSRGSICLQANKFTSRDANLYFTWSAVSCIFISPWCKICLSARIL